MLVAKDCSDRCAWWSARRTHQHRIAREATVKDRRHARSDAREQARNRHERHAADATAEATRRDERR